MVENLQTGLNFLQKLYFSAMRNRFMLKESILKLEPFTMKIQEKILQTTVENALSVKYPPPLSFKKLFLRLIIDVVEEKKEEVAEKILLLYTNLLSTPISDDVPSYCIYVINDKNVIILRESQNIIENGTTGLKTWEAAKHMAEWCIENKSIFKDRNILELGSGTGLLGFTILKACLPSKYIFTDKSEDVLHILGVNKEINFQSLLREPQEKCLSKHFSLQSFTAEIRIQHLSWNDGVEGLPFQPEIIVGADIVFDPSIIKQLVQTLKYFLHHSAYCAYIASTIRNEDTDLKFREELCIASLEYECLKMEDTTPFFLYDRMTCYRIYKITMKE